MQRRCSWFALGVLFWARAAGAGEPAPVALEVSRAAGTESCIDTPAIERAVEVRLGRPVFRHGGPAVGIVVELARGSSRAWSANIALRAPDGSELGARTLETRAKDCSALDEAVVLVVALLADSPEARDAANALPAAAAASSPPAAAPPPPPAPARPPQRTKLELPAETFAPREPWHFEAGLSAHGEVGTLPGVALGGALSLGVRPPHLGEVRLAGALLPAETERTPTADRGGRFWLALVALELCPLETDLGSLRLGGCLGQRVGRLGAAGFGFRSSARASELYYSLGASVAGTLWLLPPLGVRLGLGANVPLVRNAYVSVGPAGERRLVFRPSPVSGAALLGLVVSLR